MSDPILSLYCQQAVTADINQLVKDIVLELKRLQSLAHARDAKKALIKRRYVTGMKECNKAIKRGGARCLIVTTDIEADADQLVEQTIDAAHRSNVPVIFALTRRKLGTICSIKGKATMLMLLNVNGQDAEYRKLIQMAVEAREQWLMTGYDTMNDPTIEATRRDLLDRYSARQAAIEACRAEAARLEAVRDAMREKQLMIKMTSKKSLNKVAT